MLSARWLVVEPHGARPAVTVVRGADDGGDGAPTVVDRRPVLPGADWLADAAVVRDRQPGPLTGLILVTHTWPDDAVREPSMHESGVPGAAARARGAARAADEALCANLADVLGLAGRLVDAGTCRGLGEATLGVGRGLGDQLHLGVGVPASGVVLDGRWRRHPLGRAWSADRTVVSSAGAPHGGSGRGWLSDWTSSAGLVTHARLLAHETLAPPPLHGGGALRPVLDGVARHEALSLALARDTGRAVGQVLGGLINTLDIGAVVLHVSPAALRPRVLAAAELAVARHSFASLREGLRWLQPTLGDDAVPLGAALWQRDDATGDSRRAQR